MLDFTKKPQRRRIGSTVLFYGSVIFVTALAIVFAMGEASAHNAPFGPAPIDPITVAPLGVAGPDDI